MKKTMKKLAALLMTTAFAAALTACAGIPNATVSVDSQEAVNETKEAVKTFKVGICNYVDDASLNQIIDNIEAQLDRLGEENNVRFEITYDNCNADPNVLNQIVANFIADDVDLMIGVATPVAMTMQSLTEGKDIPVVFAAVSDPEGAGLVDSNESPGSNITGTSDFLDTNAIMNLIFANNPDAKKIGLI